MESLTPSYQHRSPIKSSPAAAASRSPAEATVSDQISTPEKPIQGPRRTRSRSLAAAARSPLEATVSDQISTQGKPIQGPQRTRNRSVAVATQLPLEVTESDQISTPEKPIQGPRRTRTRSVVFSVKEVKNVALRLQRPLRSDDDLSSISYKNGTYPGSGLIPKPSKSKTPIKLAER